MIERDVTKDNYREKGGNFIRNRGNTGFLIATKPGALQGVSFWPTARQYGAWLDYFKTKGIPTGFMEQRCAAGYPYTVPAEWPAEFDGDRTVADDQRAANDFEDKFLREDV